MPEERPREEEALINFAASIGESSLIDDKLFSNSSSKLIKSPVRCFEATVCCVKCWKCVGGSQSGNTHSLGLQKLQSATNVKDGLDPGTHNSNWTPAQLRQISRHIQGVLVMEDQVCED